MIFQISTNDIQKVEQIVNKHILEDTIVDTRVMDLEEAKIGAQTVEMKVVLMGLTLWDAKSSSLKKGSHGTWWDMYIELE